VNISYLKSNELSPDGTYIQTPGKERTGTVLHQMSLDYVLDYCSKLLKAPKKHQDGAIFPYINDTLGKENWVVPEGINGGVVFIDIDHITKDTARTIFDNFEKISLKFPCLYAIQYSSSYFLSEKNAGLHCYVKTNIIDGEEYNRFACICLAAFAQVVNVVTGIDLRVPQLEDSVILDTHNTNITQRFFLYYSPYKVNPLCSFFTENTIDKESLNRLRKNFPLILGNLGRIAKNDIVDVESYEISGDVSSRIQLDFNKECAVSNFLSNMGWDEKKIVETLLSIDSRDDDAYRRKHGQSRAMHFAQIARTSKGRTIQEWQKNRAVEILSKCGISVIEDNSKGILTIKRNHFITEFKEQIIDFISANDKVEIVAPTGVGKTTLINGGEYNVGANLFDPDATGFYSLAEDLNAVVIVPFNVTNKLYNHLHEVSSENHNPVKANRPNVMIWDQAIAHWNEIKDRTLIIDEAHCLFLDRTYRDKAVILMNKIKEDNCKIVLFTATPSGEGEELGCKYLRFNNERNNIRTDFVKVNNVDVAQYKFITKCLETGWYDRIVLFDDTTAKKIYEKIYCDGIYVNDVAYIRSDTKDQKDFKDLRDKEMLSKRLTICTCVAFNGLNFKNKGEKILVITSASKGSTTSSEIIQEAGRIRNSDVFLKVYYDEKDRAENLDENIKKAEMFHTAEVTLDIPEGLLTYDNRLIDPEIQEALRSIRDYIAKKSDIDVIVKELDDAGYFVIRKLDLSDEKRDSGNKMSLSLKKRESDSLKEDIMDGTLLDKYYDIDDSNNYKLNWQHEIDQMINNSSYVGVTIETFQNLISNSNKNNLVSTIISNLRRAIHVALITDDMWSNYVTNIEKVKLMLGDDRIAISKLNSSYKKNVELRNKYKDSIVVREDFIDLSGFVDSIIKEFVDGYSNEKMLKADAGSLGGKVGGKLSSPRKKVLDEQTGIEYSSCEECAIAIGKSNSYISKHKDRFKTIK